MQASGTTPGHLARCHGFAVEAGGRPVGTIETPLFSGAEFRPDYLIVRTDEVIGRGHFRVVPVAFVERVDAERRLVALAISVRAVAELPEELPLRGAYARGESTP